MPVMLAGLSTGVVAVVAPAPAQAAPNPEPAAATAPDQSSALRLAKQAQRRVEVMAERTEFSQVFAEPTGRLTYESTVMPQRTRVADGSWRDVDLALEPDGAKGVRPRASAADVRFSADGSGPLVTMVNDGKTFTLGWPGGKLKAPTVAGDSATYPEVLPGVDLVVRATPLGFSHALAVKTAVAATNSALKEIHFELGGDARVTRQPDGSLQAVAGGDLLASAPAPAMWDSTNTGKLPPGRVPADAGPAESWVDSPSSVVGPGDTAAVAEVSTELTISGDLVLKPDVGLLTGAATFPLFIDPAWSKGKSRWAYATNNNSNNTDTAVARVGKDPKGGRVYRSFFEFPTADLKLKHVRSAYVQMKLDHSWSCGKTATHMYQSGALSGMPRTKWATSLTRWVSAAESHANEGSGCHDSPQPDMTVNFAGPNVTSMLQGVADRSASTVTVGFCACNEKGQYETATDRWKKFFPNHAKLIADIDAPPAKPHSLQVNGVACTASDSFIGATNPQFSAVFPDADPGQAIAGTWEWSEAPANAPWTAKTAPAVTSATANTRGTTARVSGAADGKRYAVRVKGTDPAPYSISSDWSDWCHFTIDLTGPPVTATAVALPSGPGQTGTFRISSPAADVTKFRYGWSETVASEIAAETAPGVAGASATIAVTAPKYGVNVLYVQAIDATDNKGSGSLEFKVNRPSAAVARWGLETYPGRDQAAALTDGQPAQAGDTPLTAAGTTWADKGRLVGGGNVTFAGAGALTTQAGVVDTTKSYAVAAWARLDQLTGTQNIVSQDGARVASFQLQYRSDDRNGDGAADRSWCFGVRGSDTDTAAAETACALNTATAGRWTHVAGGYDAAAKKLRIWVDGVLKGEINAPQAWASTGPLRIGNGKHGAEQWLDNLHGSVADVQVYDRMLVQHDFSGQLATDTDSGGVNEPGMLRPVEVGQWDFESAVPCYNATVPNTCEAPDGAAWSRTLRMTQGTGIGNGSRGQGAKFDDKHFVDNPADPMYGKVTRQLAVSQRNAAAAESPAQWQDTPVLRTDQSFAVSVWVQPSRLPTGNSTVIAQRGARQSAFSLGLRKSTVNGVTGHRWDLSTLDRDSDLGESWVSVANPALVTIDSTSDWTHLVGVYDSGAKQLRLYVNGRLAATGAQESLWNAGGPLSVGGAWLAPDNTTGDWSAPWYGGVDDLATYQGALTSAQVRTLHDQQARPTP